MVWEQLWKKSFFSPPGTPVDPPLAPAVRGLGCPPATPSEHWYGGLGVSLGHFEARKARKVGGCGWNRCPRNLVWSHVAQDTARSWFWGCLTQTSHIQAIFSHFFGPFLGHIEELEGKNRLLVTGQSRRTCSVATVCSRLAILSGFRGWFGPKNGCFGAQNAQFWEGTSRLCAPAPGRHR